MLSCGGGSQPEVGSRVFRILGLQRVRFLVCFKSSIVLGLRLGANTAIIGSLRFIGIGWRVDRQNQDGSQHHAKMPHIVAASTAGLNRTMKTRLNRTGPLSKVKSSGGKSKCTATVGNRYFSTS